MKKADAINFVIQKIKDQNRSSLTAEDFEAFKRAYSGRFTAGLAMDFQAAAAKAGIEAPEKLDLEDMLPKRRATAAERAAGVSSGKQLRTNVTDLPEVEIKKLGVVNPITIDNDGAKLLLKNMEKTGLPMQGSFVELADTLDKYSAYIGKTEGIDAKDAFAKRINNFFPDGIQNIENRLSDARAYEQLLYEQGYLEDADPDFKSLDKEFN